MAAESHGAKQPSTFSSAVTDVMSNWVQLLFERGPLAVLAVGGTVALGRGLLPTFEIREALFGGGLLVIAAAAEAAIWITKLRSAEKAVARAFARHQDTGKQLEAAEKNVSDQLKVSPGVDPRGLVGSGVEAAELPHSSQNRA